MAQFLMWGAIYIANIYLIDPWLGNTPAGETQDLDPAESHSALASNIDSSACEPIEWIHITS